LQPQRVGGVGLHGGDGVAGQLGHVGQFGPRCPGLLAQSVLVQQLFHQFGHPADRTVNARQAAVHGFAAARQNHVERLGRRADRGQRRAQFVRDQGIHLALGIEGASHFHQSQFPFDPLLGIVGIPLRGCLPRARFQPGQQESGQYQ
jgi:hypothetical protein